VHRLKEELQQGWKKATREKNCGVNCFEEKAVPDEGGRGRGGKDHQPA